MIVAKIEIWPNGQKRASKELGRVEITNDGTGDEDTGNYNVALFDARWIGTRRFCVSHERADGFWVLVAEAIREHVADVEHRASRRRLSRVRKMKRCPQCKGNPRQPDKPRMRPSAGKSTRGRVRFRFDAYVCSACGQRRGGGVWP